VRTPADERRDEFLKRLRPWIRPGDVVNLEARAPWWALDERLALCALRARQRRLFGRLGRTRDTHSLLYLDEAHLLDVSPPRVRWSALGELGQHDLSIWRPTVLALGPAEIDQLRALLAPLVGEVFEPARLRARLTMAGLGYPFSIKPPGLAAALGAGLGAVFARAAFEHLRRQRLLACQPAPRRLFGHFKDPTLQDRPVFAAADQLHQGVDVEATLPAHFANSLMFAEEFRLVLELPAERPR
jgi:hypothetical protein